MKTVTNPSTDFMPDGRDTHAPARTSVSPPSEGGEIDVAGRRYVTADRLASMLHVTTRTLARWTAARIGPPKIKVGKLVLFELAKVPGWLASRETEPVRARPR
jgi:hypothetical protein